VELANNSYEKIVIAYCSLFPEYQNIFLHVLINFSRFNAPFYIDGLPLNFVNLSDDYPIGQEKLNFHLTLKKLKQEL